MFLLEGGNAIKSATSVLSSNAAKFGNMIVQKLIEQFIGTGDALPSLFIYAIVVTIIAVIVTVLLARVAGKMGIELGDD